MSFINNVLRNAYYNLKLNNLKCLIKDYVSSIPRIKAIKQQYDYAKLKKVRMSIRNNTFDQFITLQTEKQLGVWKNTAFVTVANPDVNVVINATNPYAPLSKDIQKNWLLHIEPPGYIKRLGLDDPAMLTKFSRVYTNDPDLYKQGGKFIASPPYVHWHLALSSYTNNEENVVYDYDFLRSHKGDLDKKANLVSINSGMNDLPGHKLRANFVTKMCESGVKFDLYGTANWNKFKQYKGPTTYGKWPIYSNSKYVLAIENEISPLYWTEKFTDAILCFSIPIYYGSPNIIDYFPEGCYISLDITKETAIDELNEIIDSDYYERNFDALVEARNLILYKYNMFEFLDAEINKK